MNPATSGVDLSTTTALVIFIGLTAWMLFGSVGATFMARSLKGETKSYSSIVYMGGLAMPGIAWLTTGYHLAFTMLGPEMMGPIAIALMAIGVIVVLVLVIA